MDDLPAELVSKYDTPISSDVLDGVAAVCGVAVPTRLRELFEASVCGLGGLTLFDEELLHQYNTPPAPVPPFLKEHSTVGAKLLASGFEDARLRDSEHMFFFASDGGGVLAYIDGDGRLGRGAGAVFAIYPGNGGANDGDFVGESFGAFLARVVRSFETNGYVDLRELAEEARR